MKPEEEVIERTLKEMFPQGTPQSARFHQEANHIWAALLDYWTFRGRKEKTVPDKDLYDTSQQFGPPVEGDLPLGAQVMDGAPYIHGGRAQTYEWPLPDPFTAGEDPEPEEDLTYVVDTYENHVLNELDELSERLALIADLPLWNEKEQKHLNKAWNQTYKAIRSRNDR